MRLSEDSALVRERVCVMRESERVRDEREKEIIEREREARARERERNKGRGGRERARESDVLHSLQAPATTHRFCAIDP